MTAEEFAHNFAALRQRMNLAGATGDVGVVAVSKGQPLEAVLAAFDFGHRDFGENYADELVAKASGLAAARPERCNEVRWHFQGRLQSNKINRLVPWVWCWQTVDSSSRAVALASRAPGANVFVQVDFSGADVDRSGISIEQAPELVAQCRASGLVVAGLMTVAPLVAGITDDVATTTAFRALRVCADQLSTDDSKLGCSMGMSGDLELAVACGSTLVRAGAALFGQRR